MSQTEETTILRLENRVAQVERRTERIELNHRDYVDWLGRIDAKMNSLSRDLGSKTAQLMGAIDSVSRRSKLQSYSQIDAEEITGINDSEMLKQTARQQRELIKHAYRIRRALIALIPVMGGVGWALAELLRFLLAR